MKKLTSLLLLLFSVMPLMAADNYITNVYGRECLMLNGKWDAIVDLYEQGRNSKIYLNKKATGKSDFYEYSFENGLRLNVPGDWNSQHPELKYYEGTVWYSRHFNTKADKSKRRFLYFSGVSYRCNVYLNGELLGSHEGSFTPFQMEVTDKLLDGDNNIIVEVNNRRQKDAIPALAFDWWNYGGITRDVMLVTLPKEYIADYFIQLDKHAPDLVHAKVSLSASRAGEVITVKIPELGKSVRMTTDIKGEASTSFKVKGLQRWSPTNPKLYQVSVSSSNDAVSERIGFRNIETRGTKVLLNGNEIFLRSISFHEEIPQRMGRACTSGDAEILLSEAKALGVNMVRLAHYQQNEYIVRRAEEMGIMLWQEIPVWQAIDFTNKETLHKAQSMLRETIMRDRNRCSDCFWGIANETRPSDARNAFLSELLQTGKDVDTTRLFVGAFDNVYFQDSSQLFEMHDDFIDQLDMIGVNKYMGWYAAWPLDPAKCIWKVAEKKPLFISEFGGEALYGQSGDETVASSWSEDYQAKLYRDNLTMFNNIPNLVGVSPWVLYDFRSPTRFHPQNQEGWNRKGLVSDQGQRKKAWYIMHDYYNQMKKKYNE
ncbi:MAG: sugar-binding domain-containing protein [Prevotella sp.]|jgi:beta-glucuronidase